MKKDLIAMNTTPSQHSMQINGNGTLKEVNSDVKFTKVWQEAFTNLNKDNHKIQIEDFQSLQHNESDKSLNLEENKSESESKCKDIQADQIEVQGQRERPHREFGVILKRWGRNDDRKVFSYSDNYKKVRKAKSQLSEQTDNEINLRPPSVLRLVERANKKTVMHYSLIKLIQCFLSSNTFK